MSSQWFTYRVTIRVGRDSIRANNIPLWATDQVDALQQLIDRIFEPHYRNDGVGMIERIQLVHPSPESGPPPQAPKLRIHHDVNPEEGSEPPEILPPLRRDDSPA